MAGGPHLLSKYNSRKGSTNFNLRVGGVATVGWNRNLQLSGAYETGGAISAIPCRHGPRNETGAACDYGEQRGKLVDVLAEDACGEELNVRY
jgi:hypothetical protein